MLAGCGCSMAGDDSPTAIAFRFRSTRSLCWLTIERQEPLADTVETVRLEHGWAAS